VPLSLNERRANGNRIIAGKEYNKRGKLVAYWMYPEHPQDNPQGLNKLRRIPASQVIHHYLPLRPGQVRGEPDIVQALLRAKTYDSYEDAELVRKETRAPFTGFLQKEYNSEEDWEFDPITGEPIRDGSVPEINAQPGTIITGTLGESLTLFDGDNTGSGYSDYQRQQLLAIAAGSKSLDVLVSGDWSKINDRIYRAQIGEYRREMQMAQEHLCIHQICERVGRWFTDIGILSNKLPAPNYANNVTDYNSREWSPHRWPHIHPTQDIESIKKELELDLTSLDAEAAKRSKKSATIQRKNVEARARKRDLLKEYKLNGEDDNAMV
jgi:lambda family phage portal protein